MNEEMENKINSIVKSLIALLSSSDDLARMRACKSLIAVGRPAVPFLVEALKNSDYLARWEAAKALDTIGDPTAAPALVQASEDDAFEVRWRAAEALAKMDVNGLKPLLQALIRNGDSVSLREVAHHVLHNVVREELRTFLLPVLTELESDGSSFQVAAAAFHALGGLGKFDRRREEVTSAYLKFATMAPIRPDLGARERARRYAKTLRYGPPYSKEPKSGQEASVQ